MQNNLRSKSFFAALLAVLFVPLMALAIKPTHLEPANPFTPHTIKLEQGIEYLHLDSDEFQSETELEYALTKYLKLGVIVPFLFEEGEDAEIEDVGLFLEGVFNPDSESTRVGGELQVNFPTGDDSHGLGGEAQLRITHPLGAQRTQAIHLNLIGFYADVDEEDCDGFWSDDDESQANDFRFGAALGYSYHITEATTLTADLYHEQDFDESNDANMAELGILHDFTSAFSASLGVGVGLDSDSPDYEAKAVMILKF